MQIFRGEPPEALSVDDVKRARALGTALGEAGFSQGPVCDALGYAADAIPIVTDPFVQLQRALDRSTGLLSALIGLFLAGEPAPIAVMQELGDGMLDAALDFGLVELDDDMVVPGVTMVPWEGLLVASDHEPFNTEHDFVGGVTGAARSTVCLTPDEEVDRAADIGTGSGVVALIVSRLAAEVVGTDINTRALRFAALNAALNGIDNVEWREGSWLEPVWGEHFDLVTCNPPFVIGPGVESMNRDGGMHDDDVSRLMVQGIPDLLTEGGRATVMINWVLGDDDGRSEAVGRWLRAMPQPPDLACLHFQTLDALSYAASWERATDPDERQASISDWHAYLEGRGINHIGIGGVVMWKPPAGFGAAGPVLRGITTGGTRLQPGVGTMLAGMLQLARALSELPTPEQVLDLRCGVSANTLAEVRLVTSDDGMGLERVQVSPRGNLSLSVLVEPVLVPFLARLDPQRTVREQVEENELDPADVVPVVRDLLERGVLVAAAP